MKNFSGPSVIIKGIGSYVPENVVTNDDLAQRVETSDEWIRTRTGIRERRLAPDMQAASDLGAEAGRRAIENAGLKPEDIDLVVVGTITPDMLFPSTACLIQGKLGLRKVPAFDVEAACSGFIYILDVATAMVRAGRYRNALVIGAEKMSSVLDWEDRTTCVLFGDGAGAVVISRTEEEDVGILNTYLGADGAEGKLLYVPSGGSAEPASTETLQQRGHYLKMNGKEVFKLAVRVMEQSALQVIEEAGITPDQVKYVVPHQANIRIIEAMAARMGLPMERIAVNLDKYGNTSAASIPLALDEVIKSGRIQRGDYILLVAFGAGLTWASSLIKWH